MPEVVTVKGPDGTLYQIRPSSIALGTFEIWRDGDDVGVFTVDGKNWSGRFTAKIDEATFDAVAQMFVDGEHHEAGVST